MDELTLNQIHTREEIKFLLSSQMGRIFLWRLICEGCHTFAVGYQHNASAYSLLSRQDLGRMYLNLCRDVDLEKTHLAEREYLQLQKNSAENGRKNRENNYEFGQN